MASATGSFSASRPWAPLERLPADVLHHDVADGIAVLVGVLDEVEDLHDRRVDHLGEELAFGHRDRLRLGVAGMHQALEHHRPVVDVVVEGQVDPAQSAVRDAALDLVLVGDHVAGIQLRQKRIRAAAVRAPALRQRPCRPRLDRPTGLPQFQQNRFDSAPRDWSSAPRADRSPGTRGISTSPPPRRRIGGSTRVATVSRSCGSVSTAPERTERSSSSSSKSGRNIAWVAIGRIVDTESGHAPPPAGCRGPVVQRR